jgi:SEC-C motif
MQTIFNNADAWCDHLNAIEKRDELLAFWQETIAQPPYSEEFVENTEMGVFLLEHLDDLIYRKQYDAMLHLRNSIKTQQPALYSKEFPYIDDALIEYALYTENDALYTDLTELLAANCCKQVDIFLPALRKAALYGRRAQVVALCDETHDTIYNYDGFWGDVAGKIHSYFISDWAQTVYENYLETGAFDHTAWQSHPATERLHKDHITQAFEAAFSGELGEMPDWNVRIKAKDESVFTDMMCYFYRYMHGKMPFCTAKCIWDLYLNFWTRDKKTKAKESVNSYFRFTRKEFSDHCMLRTSFLADYSCDVNAQLFGANHTYDFLKVVGLLSTADHDFLIKSINTEQKETLKTWQGKSHFWKYGFLANWQKADAMPQATYDRLLETLTNSFTTLPALGDDDNTIIKNTDPFADFLKNILPTQGKGDEEHEFLKALRANQSDDDEGYDFVALPSDEEDYTPPAYIPLNYVPVRTEPKIGRNDPCTCGSGKKYKKCCG